MWGSVRGGGEDMVIVFWVIIAKGGHDPPCGLLWLFFWCSCQSPWASCHISDGVCLYGWCGCARRSTGKGLSGCVEVSIVDTFQWGIDEG